MGHRQTFRFYHVQAAHYTPDDDDYQMLVAICYIKLNEYDNAKGILEVSNVFNVTYRLESQNQNVNY